MDHSSKSPNLQTRIAQNYSNLSGALKQAANYVANHRLDVATRSLRSVAMNARVSPASFSRLARALGYSDYEALKDQVRRDLRQNSASFSDKARRLQADAELPLLPRQVQACVDNITALVSDLSSDELEKTATCLIGARRVVLLGSLGSAGIVDYFAYLMSWLNGKWSVAGRNGTTLASSLSRLTSEDALVVISKAPYARRTVLGTEIASEKGASIIALTDSHAFPGLPHARHSFVLRADSPQFFSSYVATLAFVETLAGMIVSRAGHDVEENIQDVIELNRRLGEVLDT